MVRTCERWGSVKQNDNAGLQEYVIRTKFISFAGASRGGEEVKMCEAAGRWGVGRVTARSVVEGFKSEEESRLSVSEPLYDSADGLPADVCTPRLRSGPVRAREGEGLDSF